MSALKPADVVPIARQELARRRLLEYAGLMDPHWQRAPHLELIAERLEMLERREIRKLAICLPPRHGKTELSRKFVSWYIGRRPRHHIILASYGAELAEQSSRAVRSMVNDDAYPFGTKLREDSRSVGRFETQGGGVLVAVGVGSGVTGFGGDLILCDDLVKGREEAESAAIRTSTANWFNDVLRTRLHPDAVMLMVGTRWHEDDVLGSVCFGENSEWTKLVLPLYAEDDDALGRVPGEMLWPARFGPDDVPNVTKGEISTRSFAALYQQRPSPAEGNIFKLEWFKRYDSRPDNLRTTVLAIDCAAKTGVANDESAFAIVGKSETDYYVLHVESARLEFNDLERRIVQLHERWKPSKILIEDASAGTQVSQTLKRSTSLPIVPVAAKQSKVVRAELLTGIFEAGKVFFPNEPWADDVIDEMTRFPAVKHDDRTDSVMHGLSHLSTPQRYPLIMFVGEDDYSRGGRTEQTYGAGGVSAALRRFGF